MPLIACFAGDALEVFWPRERVDVDLGQVNEVVDAAKRVFVLKPVKCCSMQKIDRCAFMRSRRISSRWQKSPHSNRC